MRRPTPAGAATAVATLVRRLLDAAEQLDDLRATLAQMPRTVLGR